MAYAQAIVDSVFTSASAATQMYSEWEAGERTKNAYILKGQLALREGEMMKLSIAGEKIASDFQMLQAKSTEKEAEALATAGRMKAEAYQGESDSTAAKIYAKAAKFGLQMGGSALDVLNAFADARGKGLAQLKWQTGQAVYAKKMEGFAKEMNSAITLYGARVKEQYIPMYTYQAGLYMMAGEQAKSDAQSRMISTVLAAEASAMKSWGNAIGGQMGGGMGGGGGSSSSGAGSNMNRGGGGLTMSQ